MNSDREQIAKQLQRHAEEVATVLGWRYLPPGSDAAADCWAHIANSSGAKLTFYFDSWKKRIRVTGGFPHNYHPYGKSFEISVASGRPARDVAKDVERRLLPTYLPALAQAIERKTQADLASSAAEALAGELAKLLGGETRTQTHGPTDDRYTFRLYGDQQNLYVEGSVSAYRDREVNLKISSCSVELARSLMRTIHQFRTRQETPRPATAPTRRTLWE